jgi:hypothetical protein
MDDHSMGFGGEVKHDAKPEAQHKVIKPGGAFGLLQRIVSATMRRSPADLQGGAIGQAQLETSGDCGAGCIGSGKGSESGS